MNETEAKGVKRNVDGTFVEGSAPGPGRPPDTPEKILVKKAIKQLVKEYKETLADMLPEIAPILKEQALEGNISAIKEVHDRVMDKAAQPITGGEEGSMPFSIIIKQDGSNPENSQSVS